MVKIFEILDAAGFAIIAGSDDYSPLGDYFRSFSDRCGKHYQ
jgi:hypothetical protein